METFHQAFQTRLLEIKFLLKEKKFASCDKIAVDLIRLSYFLNVKDYLFISEYLRNILRDINRVNMEYIINENDFNILNTNFDKMIDFIINNKTEIIDNKDELYILMINLQYESTRIQIEFNRKGTEKESPENFRRIIG